MSAFSDSEKGKKSPTNSKTALVIFNPVAGRRRRVFFRKTLAAMEKLGLSVEMQETKYPGHAEELARQRTATGADHRPDLIVAAGGDGTINEVANGMIGSDLTLGIIPLGTANVLAKEIGLPQSSGTVARTLAKGERSDIHLGLANGRHFLMMAGAGYDAEVVARVNARLKYRLGAIAYAVAGTAQWLFGRKSRLKVEVGGQTLSAGWVVLAKGHFYGGKFVIARDAKLTDQNLIACIMPGRRRLDLARYLIAIGLGRLHRQRDVLFIPAGSLRLSSADPDQQERVEIDGDLMGALPMTFGVSSETLTLAVPA